MVYPTFDLAAALLQGRARYGIELAGLASLLWFGILAVSIFSFATLFIAALVQIVGIKATQMAFKSR